MDTLMRSAIKSHDLPTPPPEDPVIDTEIPYDGGSFHYRLEGSHDSRSPVLLFSNELLTDMHIWDSTVSVLKQRLPQYRLLRYDIRGYSGDMIGTTKNVNLDVLSADIANLLVVLDIPKVHAVVGVGLGGLTALAFASRYPDKLDRFIACDFDLASTRNSESNWDSSLHYARTYGMGGVGAAKLIANWFTADSRGSTQWESVRKMIASASLEGMEAAVRAFYGYDETAKIGEIRVPGLFVVGAEDRVRPEEMGAFPEKMAKGMGRLEVVERAGHFPMMENTEAFVRAVEGFLGGAVATSI